MQTYLVEQPGSVKDLIPPLHRDRIALIEGGGMYIAGIEYLGRSSTKADALPDFAELARLVDVLIDVPDQRAAAPEDWS